MAGLGATIGEIRCLKADAQSVAQIAKAVTNNESRAAKLFEAAIQQDGVELGNGNVDSIVKYHGADIRITTANKHLYLKGLFKNKRELVDYSRT